MGTQAYWMKSGWRYRGFDEDGEPLEWMHAATLADIREDVTEDPVHETVEVQRYNKQTEAYEPHGTLRKVPVAAKSEEHRFKFQMERAG
jgi:hypothetical protein